MRHFLSHRFTTMVKVKGLIWKQKYCATRLKNVLLFWYEANAWLLAISPILSEHSDAHLKRIFSDRLRIASRLVHKDVCLLHEKLLYQAEYLHHNGTMHVQWFQSRTPTNNKKKINKKLTKSRSKMQLTEAWKAMV